MRNANKQGLGPSLRVTILTHPLSTPTCSAGCRFMNTTYTHVRYRGYRSKKDLGPVRTRTMWSADHDESNIASKQRLVPFAWLCLLATHGTSRPSRGSRGRVAESGKRTEARYREMMGKWMLHFVAPYQPGQTRVSLPIGLQVGGYLRDTSTGAVASAFSPLFFI